MFKGILVSIHIVGLVLYNFFFAADVNVTQNVPAVMQPNETYTVEMLISKGAIDGFAQIKLEVPEGLHISAANQKGSSFTFKEGNARFVWYELPDDAEFKIKYKITVGPDVSGPKKITGKFSYVEDNQPQKFILTDAKFTVGGDGTPAVTESTPAATPASNAQADVTYTRSLTKKTDRKYLVTLNVKKGKLSGFARLKETIPPGFTARKVSTIGSIFSSVDQTAKFIWTTITPQSEFAVSYTLEADADVNGEFSITGEFSYLVDDETREVVSDPTPFTIGSDVVANTPTSNGTGTSDNGSADSGDGTTSTNNTTADNNGSQTNGSTDTDQPAAAEPELTCNRKINAQGNNTFLVEVTLNKGMILGFAKMTEKLPAGFTATKGSTRGARFTNTGNNARFVWTELPATDEFTVTYTLESDGTIAGDFEIGGEFTYLYQGENKTLTCGTTALTVTPPAVVDNNEPVETPKENGTGSSNDAGDTNNNTNTDPDESNNATTQIADNSSSNSGSNTTTTTRPNTDNTSGTTKTTTKPATNDGENTTKPTEVKPNDSGNSSGSSSSTTTKPNEDSNNVAQNNTKPKEPTSNGSQNQSSQTSNTGGSDNANNTASNSTKPSSTDTEPTKTVTNIPAPNTGISYKVQVLAAHKTVNDKYFSKKYKYNGNVALENHEGWVKYTIGGYAQYKAARDQREQVNRAGHNFPGPFVAAYNNGERITVQEALMISNQQWVR